MTTSARKVAIGKPKVGGAIFFAKASDKAPLPTSARTPLDAKFKSMGYAASEGLKRAIAKAYEVIRAWGGDEVARPRTELTVTVTFTLIESRNGEVAKAIFGEDAVTITAATATEGTRIDVAYEGKDGPDGAWVIDMADGDGLLRLVVPNAQQVTESFEQTYGDAEVIAYPVELTLRRDANQKFFYEYTDDGQKSA